jgi:hypothetical protein
MERMKALLISVGLAFCVALAAGGCAGSSATPSPAASPSLAAAVPTVLPLSGRISFNSDHISCGVAADFTMTIVLPAGAERAGELHYNLDGHSWFDFSADDGDYIRQSDGSWRWTYTMPGTESLTCRNGIYRGLLSEEPGEHVVQIVSGYAGTGPVLAQGSYTVTAAPTPAPTATPLAPPAAAEIVALCAHRTPVPDAAPYAGDVHPLLVAWTEFNGSWTVDAQHWNNMEYPIDQKWVTHAWSSPLQLVACVGIVTLHKVGSCGSYKRSSDGVVGQVIRYRGSATVRIVAAATGKVLSSKTFYGVLPSCADSLGIISGAPPWELDGSGPGVTDIDNYASAASTQVVK